MAENNNQKPNEQEDIAAAAAFFEENAGAGFEGMGEQDFAPPFLTIIQALSPQVQRNRAEYMPEAKQGQIFSSTTKRLYDEVHIIPVGFTYRIVEWKDRKVGGGYVRSYTRTAPPDQANLIEDPKNGEIRDKRTGNILKPTMYYLVMLEEENNTKVIIPMASTQLKKGKKWNSLMQSVMIPGTDKVMPMFGCRYTLSTEIESKNQNTWFGWRISTPEIITQMPLLTAAKQNHAQIDFLPERELKALSSAVQDTGDDDVI